MNLTRLMALGTLASHGPQHGHQIRRTAEVTNVGEWGGVSVGALYRELRLMAGEGLVTELRTEQVGRRPARTVYAITDQGRVELGALRERALRDLRMAPDPVSVALTFSGAGEDPAEFAGWMAARRDMIALMHREVAADRERLVAKGHISALVATVMRRSELAMEAELHWHDELAQTLAAGGPGTPALAGTPATAGPADGPAAPGRGLPAGRETGPAPDGRGLPTGPAGADSGGPANAGGAGDTQRAREDSGSREDSG